MLVSREQSTELDIYPVKKADIKGRCFRLAESFHANDLWKTSGLQTLRIPLIGSCQRLLFRLYQTARLQVWECQSLVRMAEGAVTAISGPP